MLGASARYSCFYAPVETGTAPRRRKLHIPHFTAPPLQIEPAALGFDLVLGAISKENRFYPLIAKGRYSNRTQKIFGYDWR